MKDSLEQLTQDILSRYSSIHAFCKASEGLTRSTVYQVLKGAYPGNVSRQIEKIRQHLGLAPTIVAKPIVTANEAYGVLQEAKCGYCRKLDKRACAMCRTQTMREAEALEVYLKAREV